MFEFFGAAAKKLTSFPFIAALALIAILLTRLEPLQDASPSNYFLYLVVALGGIFLMVVFHYATKALSIYIQIPAIILVFVISLSFAYIVVAITSRAFGGPWQPCIMLLDGDCGQPSDDDASDEADTNTSLRIPSAPPRTGGFKTNCGSPDGSFSVDQDGRVFPVFAGDLRCFANQTCELKYSGRKGEFVEYIVPYMESRILPARANSGAPFEHVIIVQCGIGDDCTGYRSDIPQPFGENSVAIPFESRSCMNRFVDIIEETKDWEMAREQ